MTLRYGIIGAGSMGREHIENIKVMGGATITAIADPDPNSIAQASSVAGSNPKQPKNLLTP